MVNSNMAGITPRIDIAFKKIFGVEENKDLLISLVNSILSDEDQVLEVTLLNPYNAKSFMYDKLSILDIKAKSVDGKMLNIEMQISDEADYDKRALYYWAKLYTDQLKTGEDYSTLSKAIGIHILNFTSIPESDKYHNVFHIREKDTGLKYFKDLELHTVELKKFTPNNKEEFSDIVAKVKSSLDMWSAFLTRNDLLKIDNLPEGLNNPNLKKAIEVLEVMNFTEDERETYENRLKWFMIEANTIKNIERKSLEKGREEGIQIGEAKGKIEVAKNLLKAGLANDLIAEVTGLSCAEITKLKVDYSC